MDDVFGQELPGRHVQRIQDEFTVRHSRPLEAHLLFGIKFDAESSERFEEQQGVIVDYLAKRLVEYGGATPEQARLRR